MGYHGWYDTGYRILHVINPGVIAMILHSDYNDNLLTPEHNNHKPWNIDASGHYEFWSYFTEGVVTIGANRVGGPSFVRERP